MTATLPIFTNFKPNSEWGKLPLFDREGWKRMPFGAFADSINERVEPSEAAEENYVGLEHLDPQNLHIRRWGKGSDVIGTKLRFRKGDIIFGRRRAYQRKLVVAEFDGICSAHAMVVRAKPSMVLPKFLPFLMMSDRFMNRAVEISVGSLSPTINWTTLKLEEFDLPQLDQQRRIAEILLTLDEAVQTWKTICLGLEGSRQAYSAQWFASNSGKKDGHFKSFRLGEVCSLIKDGTHQPPARTEQGPLLLGVTNMIDGHLRLTDGDTRVPDSFYETMHKNWKLQHGDVLLAIVGATIGKTAEVPNSFPKFTIQRSVAVLRGRKDILSNHFLRYFLDSYIGQQRIWAKVNQTAQPGVYLGEIGQIEIPIPSLSDQEEIISEFNSIKDVEHKVVEHKELISAILHCLSSRIF
jgi:restriction endonuclease S subunit